MKIADAKRVVATQEAWDAATETERLEAGKAFRRLLRYGMTSLERGYLSTHLHLPTNEPFLMMLPALDWLSENMLTYRATWPELEADWEDLERRAATLHEAIRSGI